MQKTQQNSHAAEERAKHAHHALKLRVGLFQNFHKAKSHFARKTNEIHSRVNNSENLRRSESFLSKQSRRCV